MKHLSPDNIKMKQRIKNRKIKGKIKIQSSQNLKLPFSLNHSEKAGHSFVFNFMR